MAITTIIDIVNQTFANIDLDEIEEYEYENSGRKDIRHFKSHYEITRKSILREVPWSFATAIAALEVAPEDSRLQNYAYAYKIPKDCVYARRIDKIRDGKPIEFRRVGKLIYTNQENPVLEYTKDADEPHEFDPSFTMALCYRIAAELAKSVRCDTNKMQEQMQFYTETIKQAETQTQRESTEDTENYNDFYEAMIS